MDQLTARNNFKNIASFQAYTAIATSLVSSTLATDMLLIASNVDIARFGVIKGNMFLLPAVLFALFSGFLPALRKDLEICYWGYVVRCIAPFVLSIAVISGVSPAGLVWYASISLFLSYTCATFSNNMLVKVYRMALPPEDLNRNCIFFMGFNGTICGCLCFLWMYLLNKYSGDTQLFIKCYIMIQLVTLLFEYPAVMALRKVKFPEQPEVTAKREPFLSGFGSILKDREYILSLLLMLLHGLYMGALGAYVIVFILRIWKINPLWINVGLTFFVFAAVLSVIRFGKYSRKLNYPRFMLGSSLLMCLLTFWWALDLRSVWLNVIFLVLILDGIGGIASFVIYQLQNAIPAALAPKQLCEVYIAFGTLAKSAGAFIGSCLASALFSCCGGSEFDRYRILFLTLGLLPALMAVVSFIWLKIKKSPAGR